jgi:hypothetical protein
MANEVRRRHVLEAGDTEEKCLNCDGEGIVPVSPDSFDKDGNIIRDEDGSLIMGAPCEDCGGTGRR